jgi:drug/metabolite transporter (DMT)-like permease
MNAHDMPPSSSSARDLDAPARAASPAAADPRTGVGLLLAVGSAAVFGTSGAVARPLLDAGWSPGALVTFRIGVAALLLLVPSLVALRGRWHLLRRHAVRLVAYGALAMAGVQLFYFSAIQHLSIGVALLIEYLAPVLIVGWLWARHGRPPTRLTAVGVVLSLTGLVLVLDLSGAVRVDLVGVLFALLAACGLALYFLLADHDDGTEQLPPITLAGGGLVVGEVVLLLAGLLRVLPIRVSTTDVVVAGLRVPWWLPALELAVVAGALAYVLGIAAVRRLRSTVASFVALTEVVFAVLFAWWLLGEFPSPVQLGGGVLIVAGVVAVRLGEGQRAASAG